MASCEKFTVSGGQLLDKVKQLIREGNIRRVRLVTVILMATMDPQK